MKTETEKRGTNHGFYGDVPLEVAMLAWNPFYAGREGFEPGKVVVIPHPEDGLNTHKLLFTLGACLSEWREFSTEERLLQLMIDVWHAVCRDGITVESAHNALLVIPEYRETLSGESFFSSFEGHTVRRMAE